MSTAVKPPTSELGQVAWAPIPGWGALVEETEHVRDLVWPTSILTYDRVRRDSQVAGLMRGMLMPTRRRRWVLDPNGAPDQVVQDLSVDLGLPIRGDDAKPRGRRARRFNHDHHLAEAERALIYGHAFFEQVGEVDEAGRWRLRKLAPRPQRTINHIKVARDGGLVSITQRFGFDAPEIPVSRLVAYVWDQEPGSWTGNSMLRELHRPWLLKDRILRVGAINIERAGGVPYGVAPPGATPDQVASIEAAARNFRVGETAGGVLPYGAELRFAAAAGGDGAVEFVRLQNEEMSRALLMMFMQLGQTETGSRALGGDFIDWFSDIQVLLAEWYAGVTNEHVIEDWVDWNYGPDTQAPLLVSEPAEDPELSVAELVSLVDAGLLDVDQELQEWIRARKGLPKAGGRVVNLPRDPSAAVRARRRRPSAAAAADPDGAVSLPDRPVRRQPNEFEIRAAVDFAGMEERFRSGGERLIDEWRAVRAGQIDELVAQIADLDPDDLVALSRIAATPAGADLLTAAQVEVIERAAAAALAEAAAQGTALAQPDLEPSRELAARRADATAELLARSLSEAAAREAVRRAGTGTADQVAAGVRAHLEALTDNYLSVQFGGLLVRAEGEGRRAVYDEGADEYVAFYASALLDENTCGPCVQWDGASFDTVEEAMAQFPGLGGNVDCQGGARCRCTVVGIFADPDQAFST